MAEATQFTVDLKKLIELLIKNNNIHEGQWTLMLGIQVGPGNYGPNPEQLFPGVAVSFNQVGIQRLAPGEATKGPGAIVVDAAEVNPA